MSIDFWTDSNFNEFWTYVKMLLNTISPGVMLVVAVAAVGLLLGIIVKIFYDAYKKDDDTENGNDDYEVRKY